jgi:hypothetical protein
MNMNEAYFSIRFVNSDESFLTSRSNVFTDIKLPSFFHLFPLFILIVLIYF